jgi:hypothetical protein
MRKHPPLTLAAVCVGLLFHVAASAQTAGGRGAAPARRVKGQVLSSSSLPAVRVRFERPFGYVGSQSFILYDRAQVEQYFFVDADRQGRIRRMYMAQFEGYLPSANAAYNYTPTKTVSLGGETYIVNAEGVPDVAAALRQSPQSDVARAAAFLEGKGYHVGRSVVFQRFVRLADEAKRHEFILLYVEDAGASSGVEAAMRGLSDRALKGFTVLK